MSVASRSSTIWSGAVACDSMNRDRTSSRSMLLGRVVDLVIARRCAPANSSRFSVLLPASGSSNLPLAAEQPQQRIGAQLLMIVEVLVAQRQPVDALREHLGNRVLDQSGVAPVAETARQPLQQVDLAVCLAQQQRPTVARYLTGGEPGLHPARKMGCKRERFLGYTLSSKAAPFRGTDYASTTQLCHENSGLLPLFSSLHLY